MSILIYNFLWKILYNFLPNYLNFRIKIGKEIKDRIKERYGVSNKKIRKKIIWIHSSSVGESVAALALANSMLKVGFKKNKFHYLITTNTVTSANFVKSKIDSGFPGTHQFHPFDHPKFVSKFLDHWKPKMSIFMESDFWPNLIYLSSLRKIPTILASSQMSKKSSRFWRGIGKPLGKKIFENVDLVFAVDPHNADLFKNLGSKKVTSLTSLKSIADKAQINVKYVRQLREILIKKNILLAASTHPGEEEVLIKLANKMRKNAQNNTLIIIVPRHVKRSKSIKSLIVNAGYDVKCRSQNQLPSRNDYFYIADTMGEMGSLIEVSDLVFVAGSLIEKVGGHNPAEAANLGKAVIMGPFTEKCNAQINDLVWSGGAIKIEKSKYFRKEFIEKVDYLLNKPHILEDMGNNAFEAYGYAQLRADEASEHIHSIYKKNYFNEYI